MSVSPSVRPLPRRLSRAALALTTACGALSPVAAFAQGAPQPALPRGGDIRDVRTDGFDPQITERSDLTRVNLRARNTVIDWNGFNIPENGTVDFTNGRILGGDAAVLNRDVSGNPSQLLGRLTSDSNVAVWVHNANGILVGSKAAFNTGSLVLTTLDISPEDFIRAGDSYRLRAGAGSEQSAITVQNGAQFFVRGETRGLVMVAPKIDAEGSFVAEGQDVAFVTAADVTLDYRSGSPLSVTLNRGTAVAGTSQYVRGTVAGNNALFALASQGTLTDSLLRVSAEVTTASAGSRGIVLSAGRPTTAVAGVTLGGDAAATGGIAGIAVEGPLTTRGDRGDIAASASGAIGFGARADTRDLLIVEADGALAMTADLTAGGDMRLRGRGVTLGGDGVVAHRAGRQIRVISNDGDIRGTGALTLQSGIDGDGSIVLETLGSSAGDIDFGMASRLSAGGDRRGGLTLRRRGAANNVALGTVEARTILSAAGSAVATEGLRSAGAIRTGDVNVRNALTIDAGNVTTGRLASERAIDVRSTTGASLGGVAAGGDVDVTVADTLSIGGDVTGGGEVALRGASIALGGTTLRGSGAIDITALNGGIASSRGIAIASSGNRRGDVVRLQAVGAQGIVLAEGSSITGGNDRALDVRTFTAADAPLALGDVTARSLRPLAVLDGNVNTAAGFSASGALRFGRLNLVDGFAAESTAGDLTVDRITVTGDRQGIDLRAAGTLSVQSDLGASGTVTLTSGAALTLGSIESRAGGVAIASGGALRADRLTGATGVTASGTSVTAGEVRGNGGAVQIAAAAGDIVLRSTIGRDVTLQAGGSAQVDGALGATSGAIDVAAADAITVTGGLTSSGGGTRLVSAGGTVTTSGGLTANGDATVSGTAVTLGGQSNVQGAMAVTATAGGITLDGAGARAITLRAAGGGITANGALGAQDAIDLGATGAIAANAGVTSRDGSVRLVSSGDGVSATGGVTADGDATFGGTAITLGGTQRAGGAFAATASSGGIALQGASGQAVTLRATGGGITATGALSAAGGVDLGATGDIAANGGISGQTGAVRLVSSDATVSATGGMTAGGDAVFSGTAVTLGGTQRAAGTFAATATAGGIGLQGASGQSVTLRATGGGIAASGTIATTGGAIGLTATGGIAADGGVTARGGGVELTSSGGTVSVAGGLSSDGAASIEGTALTLGGTQTARGAYMARATAGGIARAGGAASIAADSDATGGEGVTLAAIGGAIDLTDTRVTAGGTVRLTTDGAGIAVGAVDAAELVATGAVARGAAIRTGDLTIGGAVTLRAADTVTTGTIATDGAVVLDGSAIRFGGVRGASLAATAADGAVEGGDIATVGAVTVTAARGAIGLGQIDATGGNVTLTAGGALSAVRVATGGAATIVATAPDRDVTIAEGVATRGAVTVRSARDILTPFIRSSEGALTVAAPNGRLAGFAPGSGASLSAGPGQPFSLTVGTDAVLGDVIGGNIAITATAITANRIDGGALPVALRATVGDLRVTGPVTGSDVSLTAAGNALLGSVTASGAVTLGGARQLSFGEVSGASITATGATIGGTALRSTGAVEVRGGGITLDRIDGGSIVGAADRDLAIGTVTGGTVDLTAAGQTTLGTVTATGAVTLGGARQLSFGEVSGASITATGATIGGTALRSSGAITVRGGGITLDRVEGGSLTGEAAQDLSITTVGGGDVALTAAGGLTLGTVTATGAVTLGGARQLSFGEVSGASITATGATIGGTALRSSGAITVRGGGVALDRVEGGSLSGEAAQDLSITTVSGGDVALTAAGRMTLGTVDATGAVTLDGAQQLSFDSVAGGSIVARGGTIGGQALRAAGAVEVRGGGIALDRIEAGSVVADARGALTIATVATGGNATLTAADTAGLGTVAAGGALTIAAAGGLRFDRLSGASVTTTATNGDLRGSTIESRGATSLAARSIDLTSIAGGGSVVADASVGALTLRGLTAAGDATLRAGGTANVGGDVAVGGAYRITAATIALGGGQQRAGGAVRLSATGGNIAAAPGLTLVSGAATGIATGGAPLVLDGAGGIDLSGTTLRAGAGSALALRAGSGQAIRLGSVEAGSLGGFDGTNALDRLSHDAAFATGDLNVGRMAVTLSRGDLTTGQVRGSGAVSLVAASGAIGTGELTAGTLEARAGSNLSLGRTVVGGAATLEGGSIAVSGATAGTLTIRTAGSLGGAGDGATALRTTAGDLSVDAGTARLATVDSAGAATLRGGSIEVRDRLSAARSLLAEARAALTLRDATAGGDIALKAGGAVQTGDLAANGALNVEGNGVSLGATRGGGAIGVKSGGALSIGSASGNGITLDSAGIVRAGALTGGPGVTIRAADAELTGAIRGTAVRFATRDPATTALRVGDGTTGDGFRLSAGEVAQVAADTLGFDAGSGALEIGTLALAPAAGRSVELLSTGDVRVTGRVDATGTGRTIRIGGDGGNGNAGTIHIVATSDAGGRLLLGESDLDLRGNRIAAGLSNGFLDTLQPGEAGRAQAQALVGNANSALYNSQLGGGFYAPDATTLIAARSMTVRFGDYALFQNTAVPGRSSGVTVGGTIAAPVSPALRISSFGTPSSASFAFFGEINGVTGAAAALLGNPVIDIAPALLPNSRINGCLAGSGAGCLTTIVIQPTLQVFDWDSQTVFGVLQDVSLPFTPIIGGNNEELLTGLPALAPETPQDAAEDAAGQPQTQEQPR